MPPCGHLRKSVLLENKYTAINLYLVDGNGSDSERERCGIGKEMS